MTTSSLLYAAESWEKVYKAFEQVNFTAYDYDAVKQSLLDYLKLHYPENFNDYIESSQLVALVEMFAYVAELLAYRVDVSVHENLMPTATRKQSILRLAKLISYTASRNLPLRGLVKITSVSVSENVRDSQGNSLANRIIKWDDQNNPLWREQFYACINKVMTQSYGHPFKSFQIDDTIFQQYEIQNLLETESEKSSFKNGVIKFKTTVNGQDLDFELVPSDVDQDGVFERAPNPNSYFTLLYSDDGYGDASDTTGFLMYLKQGSLQKLPYAFDLNLPNRTIDVNVKNVNDVDVWVQEVDAQGVITAQWESVPNVAGINLAFNNVQSMKKYEIETLEDDKIRLVFGDGDFAEMPVGIFNVWVRSSTSGGVTVQKSQIAEKTMTFAYMSKTGQHESCTFTYSLVSALQNSAQTESAEHIKAVAPSVYYTQNRMVNGQDYNSLLLKDPSILRLKAVNRTFAGQPKYLNWNDASGSYQNVKVFGDDLRMYYDSGVQASVSTVSSRSLIDDVLEPALSLPGLYNLLIYAHYTRPYTISVQTSSGFVNYQVRPFVKLRVKFIEDISQLILGVPVQEKTEIQASLDRHWYGEPDSRVQLDINLSDSSSLPKSVYGVVNGDTDHLIYDSNLKCVVKDTDTGLYSGISMPGLMSGIQETAIRQKRFGISYDTRRPLGGTELIAAYGNTDWSTPTPLSAASVVQALATEGEVFTVEIVDSTGAFTVHSSLSGFQASGQVGESYTGNIISFCIGPTDASLVAGDAFIISVNRDISGQFVPTVVSTNLTGRFSIIDEPVLPVNAETLSYDPTSPTASWIMIVERTDDADGVPIYWTITRRDFNLIIESPTTKFWYDVTSSIVDSETKKPVLDMIRILKSNLDASRSQPIGVDQVYNVVGDVRYPDGETNFGALSITPSTIFDVIDTSTSGTSKDPIQFLSFVGNSDYVYFKKNSATGRLSPIPRTVYLDSLTYVNDVSGDYVRRIGRENLDFMWQHFTPHDHLIDPSVSNIIDMFVLTRGYYSQVMQYVNGVLPVEPAAPTSTELKSSYRNLLESKMISDTVVMHSGRVKFLFGSLAVPELRSKFRVVVAPDAKLTGDQIRARILNIINEYFKIENWDFGQSFYATELCAVIHKQLATEISSVVLVPAFPTNYFGDLFFLRSAPDEVFVSCAKLENIELITSIDRLTLKQKQ